MTYHNVRAHQATERTQGHIYQEQDFRCECPRHFSVSHEQLWGSTAQPPPLARSLHSGLDGEVADLISVLVQERLSYVDVLEFLGFNHDISLSILQYWITLKLSAPAGGPYDLLGVALAAIAELGEPGIQTFQGGIVNHKKTGKPPRSEWQLVFAQVLNHEALRLIRRDGAYHALSFTKAKWLVYRMVLSRWERLVERKEAIRAVGVSTHCY
ncbi:hypothetical protein HD806DRAFT_506419 [Xylariaceae sp. AK1471]|nr:hypothetical protein HD806DRAFT_506419 [Xylariaceae sp. AK1471]